MQFLFKNDIFICVYICISMGQGRRVYMPHGCMWRPEGHLWGSIISFHHVNSGDGTWASGFVASVSTC